MKRDSSSGATLNSEGLLIIHKTQNTLEVPSSSS